MKTLVLLLANMILPVFGGVFGWAGAMGVLIFWAVRRAIGVGAFTWGMPTLCAGACWASYGAQKRLVFAKFLFGFLLPVLCMIAFMLHPVGRQAFVYSFYWFIPVMLYVYNTFTGRYHVFLAALAGSFVAHAVGSVMYLYLLPLTPGYWLALVPVVAVERFVCAAGGTLVYSAVRKFMDIRYWRMRIKNV